MSEDGKSDDDEGHIPRHTWRGQPDFASSLPGAPAVPQQPVIHAPPLHLDAPELAEHAVTATSLAPFVEVDLVYQTGSAAAAQEHWRALEIWTRNRIYGVDWNMICIEVIDRETGKNDPNHALLGAHLAGGQIREDGRVELSYPCPRPGCEAVFQPPNRKGGFAQTSTVLRVVLRLRVLTVVPENTSTAWNDLTGSQPLMNKIKPTK